MMFPNTNRPYRDHIEYVAQQRQVLVISIMIQKTFGPLLGLYTPKFTSQDFHTPEVLKGKKTLKSKGFQKFSRRQSVVRHH